MSISEDHVVKDRQTYCIAHALIECIPYPTENQSSRPIPQPHPPLSLDTADILFPPSSSPPGSTPRSTASRFTLSFLAFYPGGFRDSLNVERR